MCDCAKKDPFAGDCCSHKKFDPTKPAQTREGHSVRIVDTNIKGISGRPLLVVTALKNGNETYGTRHLDGTFYGDGRNSKMDLVNVPEQEVRYVNLHKDSLLGLKEHMYTYMNRSVCRNGEDYPYKGFSTVKLTFEDGKLIASEVIR